MISVKTFGVVGAGTMGNGIAQCSHRRAFRSGSWTSRRRCWIARGHDRKEPREICREAPAHRRAARRGDGPSLVCDQRRALADADYIIEAIVEDADAKRALFAGARRRDAARGDPGVEHLVNLDYRDRRRHQASR